MSRSAETSVARFWWLKRVIAGVALAYLLLGIAWVAVDHYVAKQVQARFAAYRAAGEPTTASELQRPAIANEENAALLYIKASFAKTSVSARQREGPLHTGKAPSIDWLRLERAVTDGNIRAYELAREATWLGVSNWQPDGVADPVVTLRQRLLAEGMADLAICEHYYGNEREALALIQNLIHQAQHVGAGPTLAFAMAGYEIDTLAMRALGVFAAELEISDRYAPQAIARADVESLIERLLTEPLFDVHPALAAERISALDSVDNNPGRALLARPALHRRLLRYLDTIDELIELSAAQTYQRPRRGQFRILSGPYEPETMHHAILYRRALAIKLAIRLFTLDRGILPNALDQLVPHYLHQVPADPFASDGRPIGYFFARPGERPMVFSVGLDGRAMEDPGRRIPSGRAVFGFRHEAMSDDLFFDVAHWVPPFRPRR